MSAPILTIGQVTEMYLSCSERGLLDSHEELRRSLEEHLQAIHLTRHLLKASPEENVAEAALRTQVHIKKLEELLREVIVPLKVFWAVQPPGGNEDRRWGKAIKEIDALLNAAPAVQTPLPEEDLG